MSLELDASLVEAAVREAEALGRLDSIAFHRARERLYGIADRGERDVAHSLFYRRWFLDLRLDDPVVRVFGELPELEKGIEHSTISAALRAKDEGAELYVAPGGATLRARRRLSIALLPKTLLDVGALTFLLRRELLAVADMIDPEFRYEPRLPGSPAGPTHDRLLLERYAALWSASVLGRLSARGQARDESRSSALSRFVRAFPGPLDRAEAAFARFFSGPRPTHVDILAFCSTFRSEVGRGGASHCSLCGFPTHSPEQVTALSERVKALILVDFPSLDPGDGVCRQCADLYSAREDGSSHDEQNREAKQDRP